LKKSVFNILIVLFHYPIFEWEDYFNDGLHLYGYVSNCKNNIEKQERFKILSKKTNNIDVDMNYSYPINIDNIMKMINVILKTSDIFGVFRIKAKCNELCIKTITIIVLNYRMVLYEIRLAVYTCP
jgi:hypothetical protein